MKKLTCASLFNADRSIAGKYTESFDFPWMALKSLREYIYGLIALHEKDKNFFMLSDGVLASKSASIANDALIIPPCFIDEGAEIRKGAFIRGSVIVGKNCVLGNSCEVKNSILFDYAKVPHFNYVGDSILGYMAHLGAGAITSNVKCDKSEVIIKDENTSVKTGMTKLGAIIGDFCEIGCGTVLNPGTVIGKYTLVYPLSSVRGYIGEKKIYKGKNTVANRNVPAPEYAESPL